MTDRETILEIAKAKQRQIHGPVTEDQKERIERKARVGDAQRLRHGTELNAPSLSDHRVHRLKDY